MDENNTVTIEDKEYNLSDFSEEAVNVLRDNISLINMINAKEQEVQYLRIAERVAISKLKDLIKDVEPTGTNND